MNSFRIAFVLALVGWALPVRGYAQSAASLQVTAAEENLRAAAGGAAIATVLRGAPLAGGVADGKWREVTLDAWLPAASVSRASRAGDTLVAAPSAILRAAPDGRPVARAKEGMRLVERQRRDGWVRVQRRAWIWGESVGPAAVAARDSAPALQASASAAVLRSAPGNTVLHSVPGGDTIARVGDAAVLQVVERRNGWTRVRVEGWTQAPVRDVAAPDGVTPEALLANPDGFQGREVRWKARFLALQRAEAIRTDFTPGEPYILARDPQGKPGFVYVAVPPAQLAAVRRLLPLQEFAFTARVRTGRSPLMGHPVLDLVSLHP